MDRRTFGRRAGAVLLAASSAVRAQAPRVPRVGVLSSGTEVAERRRYDDFVRGLADAGYVDGRNVAIDRRYAEGRFERLPSLAADLVARKVDVIVGLSTVATQAAAKATTTIPIVFATVADPVAEGFAASLAHPERNLTGISNVGTAIAGKQLQVLKDAFPAVARVAVFAAPRAAHAAAQRGELENAAARLHLELLTVQIRGREDLDPVLRRVREWRADAFYVMQGAENSAVRDLLVECARLARLPAIYPQRNYVEAGGLMSYGANFDANYTRAAAYVGRLLKGASVRDLPIEQSSTFELVVDARTAATLGVNIAPAILARADEVIR